jgi:hypothetical protein
MVKRQAFAEVQVWLLEEENKPLSQEGEKISTDEINIYKQLVNECKDILTQYKTKSETYIKTINFLIDETGKKSTLTKFEYEKLYSFVYDIEEKKFEEEIKKNIDNISKLEYERSKWIIEAYWVIFQ